MAKFKVGDRVRVKQNADAFARYYRGKIGTIINWNENDEGRLNFDEGDVKEYPMPFLYGSELELIEQPQYQPIKPKVGERYKVVRDGEHFKRGEIIEIERQDNHGQWYGIGTPCINGRIDYLTTKYLELVEEPYDHKKNMAELKTAMYGGCIYQSDDTELKIQPVDLYGHKIFITDEPIKKTLKQKTMNFIKKLTQSAEDKALEKAGLIDSCGDLTSMGRDALMSLSYKEKKAELVKIAEELIAEDKE